MPITIPKPKPEAPPAAPPPPSLTMGEVQAVLDQRDAVWQAKLDAVSASLQAALAALPKPVPPPKRVAYVSVHEYESKYSDRIIKTTTTPKD